MRCFSRYALQVIKAIPANVGKRNAPNTRFRARQRCAKTLAQQKNSGTNTFQSSHPTRKSRHCSLAHFVFFHPDYTVGFGIAPNHALRLVGYTTGRDLHPALKTVSTCLRCDDSTSRRQMQYPSANKDENGTLRRRETRYRKDRQKMGR